MSAENVIADNPPSDGRKWECQCARCGSSTEFVDCTNCAGEGVTGHDCGEDCCCCLYPEDNVICDICYGEGGFQICLSSDEWCKANPLAGRENVERGKIEWFTLDPNPMV